jgi:16S rRNA (cytosine1402-N4)-methyltransferase
MTAQPHISVLPHEVLVLAGERGGLVVDATLGAGGHSSLLLAASTGRTLLGIDRDPVALAIAKERLAEFGDRVQYAHAAFSDIEAVLPEDAAPAIILADLGVSSMQFDDGQRGFSFRTEAPLDMRMNQSGERDTAGELIERFPERELADLFYRYGEERHSRKIAARIVETRRMTPIRTTTQLAELIAEAYPQRERYGRIHPATKCFQALRIAVNDELGDLERFLAVAPGLLAPGGILEIITFHSLEDRIVKHAFRDYVAHGGFSLATKKAILPTEEECEQNSRSRSAKLRGLIRAGTN